MAPPSPRRALRTRPRATRAKPMVSYAEPSSESDMDFDGGEISSNSYELRHTVISSPPTRKRSWSHTAPKKPQRRSQPAASYSKIPGEPRSKKRKRSKPDSPKPLSTQTGQFLVKQSGVIPPWQSLPYQILLQIFQYASNPIYAEHTFQPLPSCQWLLNVARMCRAFAEPALTALYSSPPLVPMDKAHKLVDLLKADPALMTFKYRQKVESLHIDVGQVAAYSLYGSGYLDLYGLIKNLSRLSDLEFYHQKDMSPYRDLDDSIKWTYPESLLYALEHVDPTADPRGGDKTSICRLRSWRWSSRLAGKKWPLDKIGQIHLKPSFVGLRKIAFVNYQVPPPPKGEDGPKHENILAESLLVLKNLEHLIFESSTLVNERLLPLLPTNLRTLEIINCWEVVADDFAEFLLTHGSQLRSLTLNHNQSLSLRFLPSLGYACPKLQTFQMNLTYFNMHATYRDSQPQYDHLLLPSDVPVWPSTLQSVELIQLRKWETDAAEMFFQSLLDNADKLTDLRKLVIQAILNIGWRDRASFRDKWVGSLSRVFKRVSEPPKTHLGVGTNATVAPNNFYQEVRAEQQLEDKKDTGSPKRRSLRLSSDSNRISTSARKVTRGTACSLENEEHNDSDDRDPRGPSTRIRRSARHSTGQSQRGKYAETPDKSDDEHVTSLSVPELSRKPCLARELEVLKQTAGGDGASADLPYSAPQTPHDDEDSDNQPLVSTKSNGGGKAREVVQGMCEIVDVRIDNLRPRETQATEADFLDSEPEGDLDWDGDDGGLEDGYAW